ncbi:phosphatase PAP2 family protein [Micromonospora sp. STR1_7]|uniref:Phosphatase PAP2 family protein n=1 Tax=Micromonospora parastrephiae TaxID=2806101 RepID=A0ABS1XNP7_9ACTN|nr:phosphatase PAP2 family protein [Micromonospora parastrephiae]MBM0230880.1 phosphatase PAP2 family protein [Micromonospora parastrephiae]
MDIQELSECWYRGAVGLTGRTPESLQQVALHGTDSIVVLLGLLFLACMWCHRTRPWPQRALLVTTPVAVCLAYAVSGMMKALVAAERRPCRVVTDVFILAERCPEPGDRSFPSNHATMAAALATAIVLLVPRMTVVAVTLAALAALSRAVVRVHSDSGPRRVPGTTPATHPTGAHARHSR